MSRVSMSLVKSIETPSLRAMPASGDGSTLVSVIVMLLAPFDVADLAELRLDLLAPNLGIARGGLDRGRAVGIDVAQVVGHLFQRPALTARAVPEIVAQVMEGNVVDEFGLPDRSLEAHLLEPLVDAVFSKPPAIL